MNILQDGQCRAYKEEQGALHSCIVLYWYNIRR